MTDREISYIQFLSLYKAGKNDVQIGKDLGFTKSQIYYYRKKFELPSNYTARRYTFTEEMDEKIKQMHDSGRPITEIAKELEFPYMVTRNHCAQLGLDTIKNKYNRRGHTRWFQKAEMVLGYLDEHGPTWRSEIMKVLGIPDQFFAQFARVCFDEVEYFKIKRGKGKRIRTVHEVYGELTNRPFLAIRNDPRVIDFVADKIAMKVECGRDAAVLASNLGNHLGKKRTREVIERLYTYVHRTTRRIPRRPKELGEHGNVKYTDDEFLEMYVEGFVDSEIASVLDVSTSSVQQRRNALGLPTQAQRKRLKSLEVSK